MPLDTPAYQTAYLGGYAGSTVTTPAGDALRAQAAALRASGTALLSLRDWYTHFGQTSIAAAYTTVYSRIPQDSALLDTLAGAVDAQGG